MDECDQDQPDGNDDYADFIARDDARLESELQSDVWGIDPEDS